MSEESIRLRKKEHLEICSGDAAAFRLKSNGFEKYDFRHYALTEVEIGRIDLSLRFFGNKIDYPFMISCMTGGSDELNNINLSLAEAANKLNIPIGLGSLRYAIDTEEHNFHLSKIRETAGGVPLLGNIGAAQIVSADSVKIIKSLIKKTGCDIFVVHLNPLQELIQKSGEINFKGLRKALKKINEHIGVPVIVKEVGAGISGDAAKELLELGIRGIDVAGAGGTSWAGVEIIRNKDDENNEFWDWGLPTSQCILEVNKLKNKYKFLLIGSGGVNTAEEAAKALAMGADMVASARVVLHQLNAGGVTGVTGMIQNWFETVKKIMYLTGAQTKEDFNNKLLMQVNNTR